jgi:hypothetical protein
MNAGDRKGKAMSDSEIVITDENQAGVEGALEWLSKTSDADLMGGGQ